MSKRLRNYVSDFQPHSTNDFKLRLFDGYMRRTFQGSTLDLYFKKAPVAALKADEAACIRRYQPLLHKLPFVQSGARKQLEEAFAAFYLGAIEAKLGKIFTP